MAFSLPSTTLIGYVSQGDFFGEDVARWRTIQTVTVEGVMDPDQITNMVSNGSDLPTSANTYLGQSVSVNGVDVNNSKLISLEFPTSESSITEMHDSKAKYIATYEVYITPSSNSFFGMSFNDLKSLEEFSEEISFELSEENSYSVTWGMNVKYASGTGGGANSTGGTSESSSGIAAAIALWNTITASTPASIPTQLQSNGINIWTKQDSAGNPIHWYETEVYDKQSFSCNFSRSRKLLSNNDASNYTSRIKHSLSYGEEGDITVTEDVEILGLSDSGGYTSVSARMDAAKDGADALLTGSYNRCTGVYDTYKTQLGSSSSSLVNKYTNKNISYDEQAAKITYSVSYVDTTAFYTNLSEGYSFSSKIIKAAETTDIGEVRVYTEEGEITSFFREMYGNLSHSSGGRSNDWMYNVLIEKMSQSAENISSSTDIFTEDDNGSGSLNSAFVKLTSTKMTYKPNGKTASFVRKYTTDTTLSIDPNIKPVYINKITQSIDTTGGVTKKEWFNPPNNPIGGEFYHVGREIVEPSVRKVEFKGSLLRNISVPDTTKAAGTQYDAVSYLNTARSQVQSLAIWMKVIALNVYTEYFFPINTFYQDKFYFPSFNWSFNSNYEFTASLEMKYVVPVGPYPMYPLLHSDTTQLTI